MPIGTVYKPPPPTPAARGPKIQALTQKLVTNSDGAPGPAAFDEAANSRANNGNLAAAAAAAGHHPPRPPAPVPTPPGNPDTWLLQLREDDDGSDDDHEYVRADRRSHQRTAGGSKRDGSPPRVAPPIPPPLPSFRNNYNASGLASNSGSDATGSRESGGGASRADDYPLDTRHPDTGHHRPKGRRDAQRTSPRSRYGNANADTAHETALTFHEPATAASFRSPRSKSQHRDRDKSPDNRREPRHETTAAAPNQPSRASQTAYGRMPVQPPAEPVKQLLDVPSDPSRATPGAAKATHPVAPETGATRTAKPAASNHGNNTHPKGRRGAEATQSSGDKKILVLYYTTYGHIKSLADGIAEGINAVEGATALLYQVPEILSDEVLRKMNAPPRSDDPVLEYLGMHKLLQEVSGIMFGIPSRFGSMPAQMKAWFDSTSKSWTKGHLVGKPAGVFFSSAVQGGGQETTALTTITQFVHHGMIFVPPGYSFGGRMFDISEVHGGSPYGAGCIAGGDGARQPSLFELDFARHQGEQFAKVALKLAN